MGHCNMVKTAHTEIIERVRREYGSQARFASAVGWSHSKANKALNGVQPWSDDDVRDAAQALGVSVFTMARLVRRDQMVIPRDDDVAIVGLSLTGIRGQMADDDDTVTSIWRVPKNALAYYTSTSPEKMTMFRVTGNAMAPQYNDGEYVLVDMSVTEPGKPGEYLIDVGYGLEVKIMQIVLGADKPTVELRSHNPDYAPQTVPAASIVVRGLIAGHLSKR